MPRPAFLVLCVVTGVLGCSQAPYLQTDGGPSQPAAKGELHRLSFDQTTATPPALLGILGDWRVEADGSAPSPGNVLRLRADLGASDFPRIVYRNLSFKNVHAKTRCKPEGGDTDRACGLMFRFKDSDNYYVVRANALEANVNLYHVVGGDRVQFAGAEAKVASGTWNTLEIYAEGTGIRVVWNEAELFRANDGTFAEGKVGLWTKADSVTAFDDFEATEL